MLLYEGIVVQLDSNKYHAAVLVLTPEEPGCNTVMERECVSQEEADTWLDDEMSKLTTGRGVWDV